MGARQNILIIEARFYEELSDALFAGAIQELSSENIDITRITVPGILEIPAVIRFAVQSAEVQGKKHGFSGYVALGCAIKGETDHYDYICTEAMRGIQTLTLEYALAVGNGIVTARTWGHAEDRCQVKKHNFGGRAARACLRMMEVKKDFNL